MAAAILRARSEEGCAPGIVSSRSAPTHSKKLKITIWAMRGQPGTMLAMTGMPKLQPASAVPQITMIAAAPIRESRFSSGF
jgi:hypothetical protein